MESLKLPDQDSIEDEFVRRIVARAYHGAVNATLSWLEEGPHGGKPPEEQVRLHNWFSQLSHDDQKNVRDVMATAIHSSVFGFLVLLDNKTSGFPVSGTLSDYSVHLNVYSVESDLEAYRPAESTRINRSYDGGGDLHDRLHRAIEESSSTSA